MKSFLTLLFIGLSSFGFAQSLTLSISEVDLALGNAIDIGEVVLTNTGTEAVEVALTLDPSCYQDEDDTTVQICYGEACYMPVSVTTTWATTGDAMIILAPGETSDALKFTPLSATHEMGSAWNLIFFDRNDETNQAVLEVNLGECSSVMSTASYEVEIGQAFPNPAKDLIQIPLAYFNKSANLNIYNATGVLQEVVRINANATQVQVNVSNFTSGIYFYSIVSDTGQISKTLSFVK